MLRSFLLIAVLLTHYSASPQQNNSETAINAKRNALPEIGVVASDAISIDKEKLIGEAFKKQIRGQGALADPVLEEYIQDLGNQLVVHAENVKFPFNFFLINSPDINAFAFFGGNVGIHTGLIHHADNESELVSVLAHEVAHVTQRHIARRISAQKRNSPLQIASLIGGLLLAIANPEAGMAAVTASQAAATQFGINYTRNNEKEADSIGFQILLNSGYNPNGASTFFGKLAEKTRFKTKQTAFLQTHPLPESRISEARSRAARHTQQRFYKNSQDFYLARARINARYIYKPKLALDIYQRQVDNSGPRIPDPADQYGLAIALFENEKFEQAKKIIDSLLKNDPRNPFYMDVAADIAIAIEQPKPMIDYLSNQLFQSPRNRVISLNLANLLMADEQPQQAIDILRDYLLIDSEDMLSYQLLSDAYRQSGQQLEMHQSKGEMYGLVGAYKRAIDEMHSAYNFSDNRKIEKKRIRARIEQFKVAEERLKTL